MAVSIRRICPVCAGEGSGIALREPLMPGEVAAIDANQSRDMRRTTVAGDPPTVEQIEAA
jgi:hypothetical protein